MKLYDLWLEYEKNPNDAEITKQFTQTIKKFSKITLRQFRINHHMLSYEDLLQQAYICFFESVSKYNPNNGTLEGFFLLSFKRHIIDLLRKLPKCVPFRDKECDTPNPLEVLIAQEFNLHIESLLTEDEKELYNKYLKAGVFDCEVIAKAEKMKAQDVKWMIAELAEKLEKKLKEIYD